MYQTQVTVIEARFLRLFGEEEIHLIHACMQSQSHKEMEAFSIDVMKALLVNPINHNYALNCHIMSLPFICVPKWPNSFM